MLSNEILGLITANLRNVKTSIVRSLPQLPVAIDTLWSEIEPAVYQQIETAFTNSRGQMTETDVINIVYNALYARCAAFSQQQGGGYMQQMYQQQPQYQSTGYVNYTQNFMGPGLSNMQGAQVNNGHLYSDPDSTIKTNPIGGTVMSPDVLNASSSNAKIVYPQQSRPTQRQVQQPKQRTPVEAVIPVNRYEVEVESDNDIDDNEELKAVKELTMLSAKDCKATVELVLPNQNDKFSKSIFSVKGVDVATMYTGEIKSKGFKTSGMLYHHLIDNVFGELEGKWYIHANYTKLIGTKTGTTDGAKSFKAMKTILADEVSSIRTKLLRIKDVIDGAVKLTGDGIDALITSMVNDYTSRGYLDIEGEFDSVTFDCIMDIINVLGTTKPVKFTKIWAAPNMKDKLNDITGIVLNKLEHAKIYNLETIGDIPFIMDCIGSKTTDDNVAFRTIESQLLNRRSKTKADPSDEPLQSNPCYGEVKKYTVIGIDEVAIFTNCTLDALNVAGQPDCFAGYRLAVNRDDIDSYFEYFLTNYSANSIVGSMTIQHTPTVTLQYTMYLDDDVLRFIM